MKKNLPLISIVLSVLLCSSCASYRASTLSLLPAETLLQSQTLDVGLSVVAKAFNKKDCKRYLDRDVLAEGYQPIQLYIKNNSNKPYLFTINRINLPLADAEDVAEKVYTSTAGRVAGYGAGALLIWPLIIPAIIDGVKSYQANKSLNKDFLSKAAEDKTIEAYSQMNSIVFVPIKNYAKTFSITLIDCETKKPLILTMDVVN